MKLLEIKHLFEYFFETRKIVYQVHMKNIQN